MAFMSKSEQLFCSHDYQLFANVYGDLVHDLNARTVLICKKCGKRKYIKNYIEAPINYNNFLRDCARYKKTGVLMIFPETVKNQKQYDEIFGIRKDC